MRLVMSELDTPNFREKRAKFTQKAMEIALLGDPNRSNLILTFCESSTRAATSLGGDFTLILDVSGVRAITKRLKRVDGWINDLKSIQNARELGNLECFKASKLMGIIGAEIEALGNTYDATEHAMT